MTREQPSQVRRSSVAGSLQQPIHCSSSDKLVLCHATTWLQVKGGCSTVFQQCDGV